VSDQPQWLPVATGLERKVNKIRIPMAVFSGGGGGLFTGKYGTVRIRYLVWASQFSVSITIFFCIKWHLLINIIYLRAFLVERLHKRLLLCHQSEVNTSTNSVLKTFYN
jgi:hypothetical protein